MTEREKQREKPAPRRQGVPSETEQQEQEEKQERPERAPGEIGKESLGSEGGGA